MSNISDIDLWEKYAKPISEPVGYSDLLDKIKISQAYVVSFESKKVLAIAVEALLRSSDKEAQDRGRAIANDFSITPLDMIKMRKK